MKASAAVVVDIPGRGKGLKAARDVTSGEIILSDLPILLAANDDGEFCSACLRTITARGGGLVLY